MKNNINSNIYVESPVRRKSNLSLKRDVNEIRNHETDSKNVQLLQKKYPIPAPRASIEKNHPTRNSILTESMRNVTSEYGEESDLQAHINSKANYREDKVKLETNEHEVSKYKSSQEDFHDDISIEEHVEKEFDVSVDVHQKYHDETTNDELNEASEENSSDDAEESSMTNRSILDNNEQLNSTRLVYSSESDDDGSIEDSREHLRDDFSPVSASEIKLKKPVPGSKIDNLRSQIELQVS